MSKPVFCKICGHVLPGAASKTLTAEEFARLKAIPGAVVENFKFCPGHDPIVSRETPKLVAGEAAIPQGDITISVAGDVVAIIPADPQPCETWRHVESGRIVTVHNIARPVFNTWLQPAVIYSVGKKPRRHHIGLDQWMLGFQRQTEAEVPSVKV